MCPQGCPQAGGKKQNDMHKAGRNSRLCKAASIYKSNYISCSKDNVNKAVAKQIFTINATVLSGKANQTTFHAVMMQS